MFELIRQDLNIDFMKQRHLWIGISLLLVFASITLIIKPGPNCGIDFTSCAFIFFFFEKIKKKKKSSNILVISFSRGGIVLKKNKKIILVVLFFFFKFSPKS